MRQAQSWREMSYYAGGENPRMVFYLADLSSGPMLDFAHQGAMLVQIRFLSRELCGYHDNTRDRSEPIDLIKRSTGSRPAVPLAR